MGRPFQFIIYNDTKDLVSVTSAIRIPFITMSSIHRDELLGVKSMKFVLNIQ